MRVCVCNVLMYGCTNVLSMGVWMYWYACACMYVCVRLWNAGVCVCDYVDAWVCEWVGVCVWVVSVDAFAYWYVGVSVLGMSVRVCAGVCVFECVCVCEYVSELMCR